MFSILRRLTCFICLRMLQPSRMASPDVTELCPVNILNAVVLPESLTPRRQRISAFLTPNVNPSTQRTPPYSLTRSLGSHINCNQLHSITINYNQLQRLNQTESKIRPLTWRWTCLTFSAFLPAWWGCIPSRFGPRCPPPPGRTPPPSRIPRCNQFLQMDPITWFNHHV